MKKFYAILCLVIASLTQLQAQTPHQKQQPLNVQSLTSGTYFVTVTTRDSKQTNTYKIIKQ